MILGVSGLGRIPPSSSESNCAQGSGSLQTWCEETVDDNLLAVAEPVHFELLITLERFKVVDDVEVDEFGNILAIHDLGTQAMLFCDVSTRRTHSV